MYLSLNYHSSGIRVSDEATDVGLGWSLHAGGIITRVVNDVCDFEGNKVHVPTESEFTNRQIPSLETLHLYTQNNFYDTEPDIFTYQFLGYSGKFFLDENKNVVTLKGDKFLKFDFSKKLTLYNRLTTVIAVTDQSGTQYEFEKVERTMTSTFLYNYDLLSNRLDYYTANATENVSTWFLTKITSANKEDIITFNYSDAVQLQSTRMNGEIYYNGSPEELKWKGSTLVTSGFYTREFSSFSQSNMQYNTQIITSILTNKGIRIDFGRDFPRRDTSHNTSAISNIRVSYNGTMINQWNLRYSYFESTIKHPSTLSDYENYRLKLDEVIDNTNNDRYQFTYFQDASMPYKTAMDGTDYWGFLNSGSITGTSCNNPKKLFPDISEYSFTFLQPSNHYNHSDARYMEGSSKEPSLFYCRTYSLKTIKHITGAETTFNYGLHDYTLYGDYGGDVRITPQKNCGGLRINSISDSDPDGQTISSYYTYTSGSPSASSGVLFNEQIHLEERWTNICKMNPDDDYNMAQINYLALSSSSYSSIHSIDGEYICYSQVNVNDGTGITSYYYNILDGAVYFDGYIYLGNGNTVTGYYESFYPIFSPSGNIQQYAKDTGRNLKGYNSKAYKRGLVDRVEYKDIYGKIKRTENYTYTYKNEGKVYGMVCKSGFDFFRCDNNTAGYDVIINLYAHDVGKALLTKKVITDYYENGSISMSEQYGYNDYNMIVEEETSNSNDDTIKKTYLYPQDIIRTHNIRSGVLFDMVQANIINKPIETTEYVNSTVVNSVLNLYTKIGYFFNIGKVLLLHNNNSTSYFNAYNGTNWDSGYKHTINYTYVKDKIVEKESDGAVSTYLWSYNYQYPIALINNVGYTQIRNILGNSFVDNLSSAVTPSAAQIETINSLRQNVSFPKIQVSTYEYKPLVGMTSVTAPNGLKTYYEYDDFGRLRVTYIINDNNEKEVLQVNIYNYKNQ